MSPEEEKDAVTEAEATEEKPKPRRRRAKKTDDEKQTKPKGKAAPKKAAKPTAEDTPEAKEAEKAAEKTSAPRRKRDAETPATPALVRARARYVRTSARKARLVCEHIRGKSVPEARAILAYTPRAVARDWSKVLESAVANAENNHELIGDELRITEAYADEGPTLKRYRPRAMGRATRIQKRTSHLSITLKPEESA